jgi:hypothetical protein
VRGYSWLRLTFVSRTRQPIARAVGLADNGHAIVGVDETKMRDRFRCLFAILLVLAIAKHFIHSFGEGHDSWSISEWLVNYGGGFVRRGLPGELIYQLV